MIDNYKELIRDIPLFDGVDYDKLKAVLKDCVTTEYKAGEYVCHEGEYDENCQLLLSGMTVVELPKVGKIHFHKGEIFGEIAAMSGNPRTADIMAAQPATILNIPRKQLFKLLDTFPSIKSTIDRLYRERALASHILKTPIFAGISLEMTDDLLHKVSMHSFKKGEIIFHEGDDSDAFYLVRYGFVKVSVKGDNGKEKVVAYLKEGHYFGEMGLMKEGEKRMATVSALNRTDLISISRKDFQHLLDSHPNIKSNIETVIKKREERNIQLEKDTILSNRLSSSIESGVIQTKAILIMDTSKCVRCDNCVKACAALHNGQARLVRKGVKFNNFLFIPTSCRHCEDPTCMSKCPTGAITRDYSGEIYHKDFCVGCGNCAKLCPYGNISLMNIADPSTGETIFSRIRSMFNRADVGEETPGKPGALKRFTFPGDRDMVDRSPEKRLPGDRDMIGNPVETGKTVEKKSKKTRRKAVKCDMCRDHNYMGCVYNCPRGAARRVDPTEFFADIATIG